MALTAGLFRVIIVSPFQQEEVNMGMLVPFKRVRRPAREPSAPAERPADMQPDGWLTLIYRFACLFAAAFVDDCRNDLRRLRKEVAR